jgi:HD-like signal output (HDOD) protein
MTGQIREIFVKNSPGPPNACSDSTKNQARSPFAQRDQIMFHAAPSAKNPANSPAPEAAKPPPRDERAVAMQLLNDLAAEVSAGKVNLPSFPDVVIRVRKALSDPEAKVTQIMKIVSTEPQLAARLIQVANSASFNPSGKPLTDLRAAITRLGHRPVQSAAMSFAIKQLRLAPALRAIAKPLNVLWEESITVASICQVLARRTKVSPDEAFLTGLLHGMGRMYIMVRSVGKSAGLSATLSDMINGWHPAIGKAVLENWGFSESMSEAISDQYDYDHTGQGGPDLTDILVVSVVLAVVLREPGPRTVTMDGINSFQRIGLTSQDCSDVLRHAEHQLGTLHAALGC